MKVKELMKQLQDCDPESEVWVVLADTEKASRDSIGIAPAEEVFFDENDQFPEGATIQHDWLTVSNPLKGKTIVLVSDLEDDFHWTIKYPEQENDDVS